MPITNDKEFMDQIVQDLKKLRVSNSGAETSSEEEQRVLVTADAVRKTADSFLFKLKDLPLLPLPPRDTYHNFITLMNDEGYHSRYTFSIYRRDRKELVTFPKRESSWNRFPVNMPKFEKWYRENTALTVHHNTLYERLKPYFEGKVKDCDDPRIILGMHPHTPDMLVKFTMESALTHDGLMHIMMQGSPVSVLFPHLTKRQIGLMYKHKTPQSYMKELTGHYISRNSAWRLLVSAPRHFQKMLLWYSLHKEPIEWTRELWDYIDSLSPTTKWFHWSAVELAERCNRWHQNIRYSSMAKFAKAVWKPHTAYDSKIEVNGVEYHFEEMLSYARLREESRMQHNCVHTYVELALSGAISLWSMTYANKSGETIRVTIEMNSLPRQCKGQFNREITAHERVAINRWVDTVRTIEEKTK